MDSKLITLSVNILLLSSILLTVPALASDTPVSSSITYNGLNNNPQGDYVWFNAHFKPTSNVVDGTTIYLTNSKITIIKNNQNVVLNVPDAIITFSSAATRSTTSFDSNQNAWITTVPLSGTDNIFLTGLLYHIDHQNDIFDKQTIWSGDFSASQPNVNINWQYGIAVYTMGASYSDLGVQASHQLDSQYSSGTNAGTPHNLISPTNYLVSGGSGGGGSNWTGSMSGTAGIILPVIIPPTNVPEFPSVAIPITVTIGAIYLVGRRKTGV